MEPPDDLDTIRVAYEGFARGDLTHIFESLDPEVEFHNPANAIEPGVRHGIESFKVGLQRFLDSFEVTNLEIDRITEVGEQFVVLLHMRGKGRGSGISLDQRFGHVITMRKGKMVRFAWFTDQTEALAAAGLME